MIQQFKTYLEQNCIQAKRVEILCVNDIKLDYKQVMVHHIGSFVKPG